MPDDLTAYCLITSVLSCGMVLPLALISDFCW